MRLEAEVSIKYISYKPLRTKPFLGFRPTIFFIFNLGILKLFFCINKTWLFARKVVVYTHTVFGYAYIFVFNVFNLNYFTNFYYKKKTLTFTRAHCIIQHTVVT